MHTVMALNFSSYIFFFTHVGFDRSYSFKKKKLELTRMHSSRMHTTRSWGGAASVHAGIHPLGMGLETPPGVGLETPFPGCGPGDPLGVGLETLTGQTPQPPPGCGPGDLQGMLGYTPWRPARHA